MDLRDLFIGGSQDIVQVDGDGTSIHLVSLALYYEDYPVVIERDTGVKAT